MVFQATPMDGAVPPVVTSGALGMFYMPSQNLEAAERLQQSSHGSCSMAAMKLRGSCAPIYGQRLRRGCGETALEAKYLNERGHCCQCAAVPQSWRSLSCSSPAASLRSHCSHTAVTLQLPRSVLQPPCSLLAAAMQPSGSHYAAHVLLSCSHHEARYLVVFGLLATSISTATHTLLKWNTCIYRW